MAEPGWSAALVPQLEHHTGWLSRAIQDLRVEQACFEMKPGRPSIAWLVGHLTVGADSLTRAVGGLEPGLAPAFLARHGHPHWSVEGAQAWDDLRDRWTQTSERTRAALDALAETDFERAPGIEILPQFAERLGTRHAFLAGEIFHFAYHLGQIGSLRAAQDLGWS